MNYVFTVADSNITKELDDFIKSIRVNGWKGTIFIYCPENSQPEVKYSNCTLLPQKSWWKKDQLRGISNTSALLKPLGFLNPDFKDGDLVLYMDSADLMVFCNLDEVFSQIPDDKAIGAKKYLQKPMSVKVPKLVQKNVKLNLTHRSSKGVNSGVILARICDDVRVAGQRWANMLKYIPETGGWFKTSKKIGDQIAFNQIFGELEQKGLAFFLPKKYNYHRWASVKKLKFKDGKAMKKDKDMKIVHGSGSGNLPVEMRKFIRGVEYVDSSD